MKGLQWPRRQCCAQSAAKSCRVALRSGLYLQSERCLHPANRPFSVVGPVADVLVTLAGADIVHLLDDFGQ